MLFFNIPKNIEEIIRAKLPNKSDEYILIGKKSGMNNSRISNKITIFVVCTKGFTNTAVVKQINEIVKQLHADFDVLDFSNQANDYFKSGLTQEKHTIKYRDENKDNGTKVFANSTMNEKLNLCLSKGSSVIGENLIFELRFEVAFFSGNLVTMLEYYQAKESRKQAKKKQVDALKQIEHQKMRAFIDRFNAIFKMITGKPNTITMKLAVKVAIT